MNVVERVDSILANGKAIEKEGPANWITRRAVTLCKHEAADVLISKWDEIRAVLVAAQNYCDTQSFGEIDTGRKYAADVNAIKEALAKLDDGGER